MPPLIGITTSNFTSPTTGWAYNRAYVACIQAIEEVGGLPVLIPVSVDEATLRGIYDRLDGVLLPGGGDVRPDWYGEQCHPLTGNIDDPRDRAEIQLARWAEAEDRPLFGICRGHQVLNVAYGGTLVQDIPSEVGTSVIHTIPDRTPRNTLMHEVRLDPSSRLAAIIGANVVKVNSIHHQSVDKPAPNARVTAFAPDEVVEALELPDKKFILSVQWHPEDLYRDDEAMKRLFSAFVQAANGHSA